MTRKVSDQLTPEEPTSRLLKEVRRIEAWLHAGKNNKQMYKRVSLLAGVLSPANYIGLVC